MLQRRDYQIFEVEIGSQRPEVGSVGASSGFYLWTHFLIQDNHRIIAVAAWKSEAGRTREKIPQRGKWLVFPKWKMVIAISVNLVSLVGNEKVKREYKSGKTELSCS